MSRPVYEREYGVPAQLFFALYFALPHKRGLQKRIHRLEFSPDCLILGAHFKLPCGGDGSSGDASLLCRTGFLFCFWSLEHGGGGGGEED